MMLFFLDGSALGKRYVAEPGTPLVDHWLVHVVSMPTPIAGSLCDVDADAWARARRHVGVVADAMAISDERKVGENHGAVSILRSFFGPVVLVISGRAA